MNFFRNLIKNAIRDGISKKIDETVGNATEEAVSRKEEMFADQTAKHPDAADAPPINRKALQSAEEYRSVEGFNGDFDLFPKWNYTIVEDLSKDAGEEYESLIMTVPLTDDLVRQYQSKLSANGFLGDWQIMSKEIAGKRFIVDFTFVPDSQIQYLIQK